MVPMTAESLVVTDSDPLAVAASRDPAELPSDIVYDNVCGLPWFAADNLLFGI